MTITELTPPPGEPLTLAETKTHLRVDASDEDTLIAALIRSARIHIEQETGLALLTRTDVSSLPRRLAAGAGDSNWQRAGANH